MDDVAVSCRYHTQVKHGRYFDDIGLPECYTRPLFHFSPVVSDSFGFVE